MVASSSRHALALLLTSLLIGAAAHAQPSTARFTASRAVFRTGLGHEQIREDLIVPWRFTGGGLALGGGYNGRWTQDALVADLLFKLQPAANKQGHITVLVALDGEAAWDRSVADLAGGCSGHAVAESHTRPVMNRKPAPCPPARRPLCVSYRAPG